MNKDLKIIQLQEALRQYEEENDQLKAENENLKKEVRILKSNRLNMFEHLDIVQENKKLKQTLAEIKEIINEFAKEDILTFPDFSKEQNYKLIQKQCSEPIIQILQKINEVENEKESNRI